MNPSLLRRRCRVARGAVVQGLRYQLGCHLPRTALACFGITVGAAGLVAVLSVGGGLRRLVVSDAQQSGGNLSVIVAPPPGTGRRAPLTLSDIDRIGRIPGVEAVVPETSARGRIAAGGRQVPARVRGVTAGFLSRGDWRLDRGRGIAPEDMYSSRRVCVLGHSVASRLFPGDQGTEGAVSIDGLRFAVVGTLEELVSRDPLANEVVLVPITTSLEALRVREIGRATVRAAHVEEVPAVVARIRAWLAGAHRGGDFRVRSAAADARGAVRTLRAVEVSLGALAAICLGLGGLGILGAMLASLDERVYEMGLRAAVGAPGHALMLQLLAESLAMNLAGFLPGIALGAGVSSCVEWSVHLFLPEVDFRAGVTGDVLLAAGLASGGVGLLSGIVPALRAARMSPVAALKEA